MDHTNKAPKGVLVSILDKEFIVACPPNSEEALMAAAELLDNQMRQIRHNGRVIGTERIAVMAALNISHVDIYFTEHIGIAENLLVNNADKPVEFHQVIL